MESMQQINIEDFPILKDIIYLDNSATTQKPQSVINSISKYYSESNANVHRGIHDLSVKATLAYEDAHQVVADFIGAEFEEIIFTSGTTHSLNLVANSLGKSLEKGDEIVLTQMEHHSNIVPWQQLAKRGVIIKFIPITPDYKLDMEEARQMITDKTKIVSVTHISNVLGTINPVEELANLAHQKGAIMIVDAAQSVPHIPINVKELNCDFLAFSGHKMCGPTGIGVLYGKKRLLEVMEPFMFGGDMIKEVSFKDSTWNDLPWKFEAGTPPIAQAVGLSTAISYLKNIGMEEVAKHNSNLTSYAIEKLNTVSGLKIIGPSDNKNRGAVISFELEGIHPHDISEILNREKIAVRGGHHCAMPLHNLLKIAGTTRASFYIYNTFSDIDVLVESIKKVQEIFK
jgi:cysteine desulfurase / selenocysteine lyase